MTPTNQYVSALLTDYYQLTMGYAYWKLGKQDDAAVFDLFFRKNPFGGEFTVFAGLQAAVEFLEHFSFSKEDIDYLKKVMRESGEIEDEFFEWLAKADLKRVKIWAMKEGSPAFPHVPLLRVEGPLAICQLLETTLLNLINFASLITTNAVRYKLAAGTGKKLLEFGLRRAQGPDGAMSASRYSYLGGFDATSNVQASRAFDIGVRGTHAHAFVSSFKALEDLNKTTLFSMISSKEEDLVKIALEYRAKLPSGTESNEGELAAFLGYAMSWPNSFLALVDTYNTLTSGVPNFCAVALALYELGYKPLGVRLDSGDLAYLSVQTREYFESVGKQFNNPEFKSLSITASNEINEATLLSLNQQGHEVDTFGIGTNLVTCQNQTALGGVYKLVMINGSPRLKLSQELSKVTIPGRKEPYRLYDSQGHPILDLMITAERPPPKVGERVMCRHPFQETKRAWVVPSEVVPLHTLIWDGKLVVELPTTEQIRQTVKDGIAHLRPDHIRFMNPTPYKVSVSASLYDTFHDLWLAETPVSCIQ